MSAQAPRRRVRSVTSTAGPQREGRRERHDRLLRPARRRCPPARRCSRPAPAPARRSPSPRWSPATSPRASRRWTSCSSSASAASRPASCASGYGNGWSAPATASSGRADPDDEVLVQLTAVDADELTRAQAPARGGARPTFDAATVTTTHGFCQQVLLALGTAGDLDPDARARRGHLRPGPRGRRRPLPAPVGPSRRRRRRRSSSPSSASWPPPSPRTAPRAACPTRPPTATPACGRASPQAYRRRSTSASGAQHLHRLRRPAAAAAAVLTDPVTRDAALSRLRGRYRIVLVDEFQDTDPVQWEILRDPFHGHATLVLIGDPKQAIYGFRGADVLRLPRRRRDRDVGQHAADQLSRRRRLARRPRRRLPRRRARRRAHPRRAGDRRPRRAAGHRRGQTLRYGCGCWRATGCRWCEARLAVGAAPARRSPPT